MKLGNRLLAVAHLVEEGSIVADIGTDHAYLPIYLVENKIIDKAFACDVHTGPYQAAKQAVKNNVLEQKIEVRLGDGISVLAPNEANFLTIAGMGGTTMIEILSAKPQVLCNISGMVLQPQNAANALRKWLWQNGWCIADEELVIDEGRMYEILLVKHGKEAAADDILADIGKILWEKRHPLLKEHIENLLASAKRVLRGMQQSEIAKSSPRYTAEQEKIAQLEEKLKWL